ncbi:GNAT family N-acetyltransferase [Geosporobacter ferrireducens]|uniref:GNAT family N-acetyltransferase n=1 Tax=Geosporobacter ferrireducens TaxID=1424294 RepID=UPI002352748F|nr:GNAT family N-acetyltransferase [Geosporobacter ferrireducens]
MNSIRKLTKQDSETFSRLIVNAYPGFGHTQTDRENFQSRMDSIVDTDDGGGFYGFFLDETIVGGMRLFDFQMNLFSQKINVGGIGAVCVDLLHKKERIAKELLTYFLEHYRDAGSSMVMLYPFNANFYRRMGFGYGTKMNQYRVKPESFPKGTSKEHIVYLNEKDQQAYIECYQRYMNKTNGLLAKKSFEIRNTFDGDYRIVGYKEDGKLLGYVVFTFEKEKESYRFIYNMIVKEFIYETKEALAELCTFLHTQADQVHRIHINLQEESFHYLLSDPTNGLNDTFQTFFLETDASGIGVMYRIINVEGIFKELHAHNFNDETCRLKLWIEDDFFPKNNGSWIIHFINGKAVRVSEEDYEAEVSMKICDFSSMLMGAVNFRTLYHFGLAEISDEKYVGQVNRIFMTDHKPVCMTMF